jgi:hypothetical protein
MPNDSVISRLTHAQRIGNPAFVDVEGVERP